MSRRPLPALPTQQQQSLPPQGAHHHQQQQRHSSNHASSGDFDHTCPRPPVPGEERSHVHSDWGHPGEMTLMSSQGGGGGGGGGGGMMMAPPPPGSGSLGRPGKAPQLPARKYQHYHPEYTESGVGMMVVEQQHGGKGSNLGYKDSSYRNSYETKPLRNATRSPTDTCGSPTTTRHHHQQQQQQHQPAGDNSNSGSTTQSPAVTMTASCLRWAESLQQLLADGDGVELFRRYLQGEGSMNDAAALDFWFACEGLRKHVDPERIGQLVKVIYRRFFRKSSLANISDELRAEVGHRVKCSSSLQPPVVLFDEAQTQIEYAIANNTYPNFLKSDIYLQHVQSIQTSSSSGEMSSYGGESGSSSSSSNNNLANLANNAASLPIIYEDTELIPSLQTPGTGCMNTGYHTPNLTGVATGNNPPSSGSVRLTKDLLLVTQNHRAMETKPKPEAFAHSMLMYSPSGHHHHSLSHRGGNGNNGGGGGATSAPVAYNSYNPVSRQDSEMQSVSSHSDARTESDNVSLTDSSIDGVRSLHRLSKKRAALELRHARENAALNRETHMHATVIPRTQRPVNDASRPCHPYRPDQFARLLTEKLEMVQRELDSQEMLERKLNESGSTSSLYDKTVYRPPVVNTASGPELQSRDIETAIRGKFEIENDQDILDQHVSRVFSQPNSPGIASPRPHSPTRNLRHSSSNNNSRSTRRKDHPHPHYHHQRAPILDTASLTFSADSGNVHDYYPDGASIPKSRSMPEYQYGGGSGGLPPPLPPPQQQQQCGMPPPTGCSSSAGGRRTTSGRRVQQGGGGGQETDSGVSVVSDTPPPVGHKVLTWLMESSREGGGGGGSRTVNYSHSEVSTGSSTTRHHRYTAAMSTNSDRHHNTHHHPPAPPLTRGNYHYLQQPITTAAATAVVDSRSSSVERGGLICAGNNLGAAAPSQPFIADPSLPPPPLPNTASQLEEACKRLKDTVGGTTRPRNMMMSAGGGGGTQRSNTTTGRHQYQQEQLQQQQQQQALVASSNQSTLVRRSFRASKQQQQVAPLLATDDVTMVVYNFCEEEYPYRTKIPGKQVTLRQFKEYLPKKGSYRFFFKTECEELDNQVIQEEVSVDDDVLPLWEGRIMATVKPID